MTTDASHPARRRAGRRPEAALPPPEVWAGPECAFVEVRGRRVDQLELTSVAGRPELFDLFAELGASAVRVPVLWGRVERERGRYDWTESDQILGRLRDHGIEPVVGLVHHGYGPPWARAVLETDDFPTWASRFGDYAAAVARRYPWIRWWLPVNEPVTTARMTGLYGHWWPHARDLDVFVRLLAAMCLGVREAADAIDAATSAGRLLVNDDVGITRSTPPLAEQAASDSERRWLGWDLLTGRVTSEHRLASWFERVPRADAVRRALVERPARLDAIGVDYYVTSDRFLDHRPERYPEPYRGGNGRIAYADVELLRVLGYGADGFDRAIRETYERYRLPIVLAEVGLAGAARDQVAWWREAWAAAVGATEAGIPVTAVTAWAAFGASGWNSLLTRPDAGYEPGLWDVRRRRPRRRLIARAVAATARARPSRATWLGWWRRPEAILYPPDDRLDPAA